MKRTLTIEIIGEWKPSITEMRRQLSELEVAWQEAFDRMADLAGRSADDVAELRRQLEAIPRSPTPPAESA